MTFALEIKRGRAFTVLVLGREVSAHQPPLIPYLEFLRRVQNQFPEELPKLVKILDLSAEFGPPKNDEKSRPLKGTDGLFEFKTGGGLRLVYFYDAGPNDYLYARLFQKRTEDSTRRNRDGGILEEILLRSQKRQDIDMQNHGSRSIDAAHSEILATMAGARETLEYQAEAASLEFTEAMVARMETTGLSRADLARATGVSPAYITRILRGDVNFTLNTMIKIARAVGCDFRVALSPRAKASAPRRSSARRVARQAA